MFYKTISLIILLFASHFVIGQYVIDKAENDKQEFDYLLLWKHNSDKLIKNSLLIPDSLSDTKSIDIPVFFNLSVTNFNDYSIDSSIVKFDNKAAQILCYFAKNSKSTSLVLSVYEYYKDFFQYELRQNGLPESLAILPFALSAVNPQAESLNSGRGIWQLKYAEARYYGLQVDSLVDERMSIEKSTFAAINRLKSIYNTYGDWQLSLSAFVCGNSNLNNFIADNNHNTLPSDCKDISSAFMAAKVLYDNLYDLGIDSLIKLEDIKSDTVIVSQNLHFKQIADVLLISINVLRQLNPEFIKDFIPASDHQYVLRLPIDKKSDFYLLEDSLYNYKKDVFVFAHKLESPPSPNAIVIDKASIPKNSKPVYYVIKQGDNIGYISEWFNVSQRQLKSWNGISNPRKIRAGKKLKIYVPKSKYSYYKKINSLNFKDKQVLSGAKTIKKVKTQSKDVKLDSNYLIYTVRKGDSPYHIAKKYPGVSADDIMRWNNISNPSKIRPGEKLKIKKIKR